MRAAGDAVGRAGIEALLGEQGLDLLDQGGPVGLAERTAGRVVPAALGRADAVGVGERRLGAPRLDRGAHLGEVVAGEELGHFVAALRGVAVAL